MNPPIVGPKKPTRVAYHRSYRVLALTRARIAHGVLLGVGFDGLLVAFADELLAFHDAAVSFLLSWSRIPHESKRAAVGTIDVPIQEVPTFLPHGDLYTAAIGAGGLLIALGLLAAPTRPWKVIVAYLVGISGVSGCYFFFFGDRFPIAIADFVTVWTAGELILWLLIPLLYAAVLAPLPVPRGTLLVTTAGAVMYAVLFSIARLAALLALFHHAGVVWMATAYFGFGFLADFLYVVAFYSFAIASAGERLRQHQEEWRW